MRVCACMCLCVRASPEQAAEGWMRKRIRVIRHGGSITAGCGPAEGQCWTSDAFVLIGLGFMRRRTLFVLGLLLRQKPEMRSNQKAQKSFHQFVGQ